MICDDVIIKLNFDWNDRLGTAVISLLHRVDSDSLHLLALPRHRTHWHLRVHSFLVSS